MAKKHKAKSERMRRRIMRRRISLIIGALFVIGIMTVEILVGDLGEAWLGTPAYYGLVIVGLIIGFGFLWVWVGAGEKTDMDELEERMELLFRKQTRAINKQSQEIVGAIKEGIKQAILEAIAESKKKGKGSE